MEVMSRRIDESGGSREAIQGRAPGLQLGQRQCRRWALYLYDGIDNGIVIKGDKMVLPCIFRRYRPCHAGTDDIVAEVNVLYKIRAVIIYRQAARIRPYAVVKGVIPDIDATYVIQCNTISTMVDDVVGNNPVHVVAALFRITSRNMPHSSGTRYLSGNRGSGSGLSQKPRNSSPVLSRSRHSYTLYSYLRLSFP